MLLFHHLSDEIVVKPNFLFRKDQSLFVIPDFYKLIFSQLSVRFTHFAFIRFSMNARSAKAELGGLKWTRTTDLALIRRAL